MGVWDYLVDNVPSLPIARERLALAKDQLEIAEKEKLKVEKEVERLRAELAEVKKERNELKARTQTYEAKEGTAGVSEKELTLLRVLAKMDENGCEVSAEDLARETKIGLQEVKFRLEEMTQKDMVYGSYFYTGQPTTYSIGHEGRRVLIQNQAS